MTDLTLLKAAIAKIIVDVCDLPDRTSPEDWPEAMLVTGQELETIIERHISAIIKPAPETAEVIHISEVKNDNRLISPVEMLENELRALKNGRRSADGAIVLFVERSDTDYHFGYGVSKMKASEVVALLEIAKPEFISMIYKGRK